MYLVKLRYTDLRLSRCLAQHETGAALGLADPAIPLQGRQHGLYLRQDAAALRKLAAMAVLDTGPAAPGRALAAGGGQRCVPVVAQRLHPRGDNQPLDIGARGVVRAQPPALPAVERVFPSAPKIEGSTVLQSASAARRSSPISLRPRAMTERSLKNSPLKPLGVVFPWPDPRPAILPHARLRGPASAR